MLNIYIILMVFVIVFLFLCCVEPSKIKWICQLVFQGLCTAYPTAMFIYYNSLPIPDSGKAPGLAYVHETFISFLSMAVFAFLLIVGIGLSIYKWPKD